MTSPVTVEVVLEEPRKLSDNSSIPKSPSSTISDYHSWDESCTEEKILIPRTLIEDELKLALNKVRSY